MYFKNNIPKPNIAGLPNLFGISKQVMINNIINTGGNNNHRVHPPGLPATLNVR